MSGTDIPYQNLKSCLSPSVHHLICELWKSKYSELQGKTDRYNDTPEYVKSDGTLDWNTIKKIKFHDLDLPPAEQHYESHISNLIPVCVQSHKWILQVTQDTFEQLCHDKLKWTGQSKIFLESYRLLKSGDNVDTVLSLLLCTAALERALGDVYLLRKSPCPFLLKDLLATDELQDIFGQITMFCLHVLIGPPTSLNLRNIVWHGFNAPMEIPSQYISFLLVFTASLSETVQSLGLEDTIKHRQPFQLSHIQYCQQVFPEITSENISALGMVISSSDFILPMMEPYWQGALKCYQSGRYGQCCVLLLPQLENSLRTIFCRVNQCPERVLTAESSVFYTTFDEMLSPILSTGEANALVSELGDSYMELLLDLLVYLEGLRIRDHISHGEVDVMTISQNIANHVLSTAVAFCLKYSNPELSRDQLKEIPKAAANYQSCFHPVSYLRRSLETLFTDLANLSNLPKPSNSDEVLQKTLMSDSGDGLSVDIHKIARTLVKNMHSDVVGNSETDIIRCIFPFNNLYHLVTVSQQLRVKTLFQTRRELEIVSLLRHIVSEEIKVVNQIRDVAVTRFQQWERKELRSRQRNNYLKCLKSIPCLSSGVRLLSLLVITQLSTVNSIPELSAKTYQHLLKYLKGVLQYTENLATLTSLEKNKWDESCTLTEEFVHKTDKFYS
ncbi:endoplasmic reticulum membrane-associated RNA degradation protein-like [Glandiceps talaboti]